MRSNYFVVDRGLLESDRWLTEPFTRGQAWIDLFGLANHTDGFIRVRGLKIDVKRGQLGRSQLSLAERWKWSRGKVIRYLEELENDGDISIETVQQNSKGISIITIIKYDYWQLTGQQTVPQKDYKQDNKQYSNKKNKKNKKNDIDTETIVSVSAPTPSAPKVKPPKPDPLQPMNLAEAITWFKSSPNRRDLHIIAEWADTIKPDCNNRGQWLTFMKRHLRAAQDLAPFSDDQLAKAYSKIVDMRSEKDFKPALETLRKFVT